MKVNLTKIQQRTAIREAEKRRVEGTQKSIDEQAKLLASNQTLARASFLALAGACLYLASVAYNSTHLDLLLNTKASVLWSVVELPRRWVLSIGAIVLVGLLYETAALHDRLDRQYRAWIASMPADDTSRQRRLLWLHGGLVSDVHSASVFGRTLSQAAEFVLYSIMWIAPLLTLLFVQAVLMPVHSELLSNTLRVALLLASAIVGHGVFRAVSVYSSDVRKKASSGKVSISKRLSVLGVRPMMSITTLVVLGGLVLSFHVLLWSGERLQVGQSRFLLWSEQKLRELKFLSDSKSLVWRGPTKNNLTPSFLGIKCPSSPRTVANENSYAGCPSLREPTMLSTLILREHLTKFSTRFAHNYQLADTAINGSSLTAQERKELALHTDQAPLHPNFESILLKVPKLNLRSEDVRYADFSRAFAPKVNFSEDLSRGAIFVGASLQGSSLILSPPRRPDLGLSFLGADMSGGDITIDNSVPSMTLIGVIGIRTKVALFGPMPNLTASDFRFSQWNDQWWAERSTVPPFQAHPPQAESFQKHENQNTTAVMSSNFSGARLSGITFINVRVSSSQFVGASIQSLNVLGRNEISNSDFSLSTLFRDDWYLGNRASTTKHLTKEIGFTFTDLNLATFNECNLDETMNFHRLNGFAGAPGFKSDVPGQLVPNAINRSYVSSTELTQYMGNASALNPIGPFVMRQSKCAPKKGQSPTNTPQLPPAGFPENYWTLEQVPAATTAISGYRVCNTLGCRSDPNAIQQAASVALTYACDHYALYLSGRTYETLRRALPPAQQALNKKTGSESAEKVSAETLKDCRRNINGELVARRG
jgi:uncharacterized protein YjbI with pentapeptide repeats